MIDVVVTTESRDIAGHFGKVAVSAAAHEMAKIVYALSQAEVPVDTGRLKASGRIEWYEKGQTRSSQFPPVKLRTPGEAAVVYGGQGAEYAAAVHEGVRGTGRKGESVRVHSYRQGKSQFLRDPTMEAQRLIKAATWVLQDRLRQAGRIAGRKKVRAVRNKV